jgi:hypothetical protein
VPGFLPELPVWLEAQAPGGYLPYCILEINKLFLPVMNAARQFFTATLALVMILSSMGPTLAAHLCKGEFKQLGFSQQEHSCCPAEELPPHCSENDHAPAECCESIPLFSQADQLEEPALRIEDLQLSHFDLAFTIACLAALLQPETAAENTNFAHYPPPIIVRDIPVFVQSFLL